MKAPASKSDAGPNTPFVVHREGGAGGDYTVIWFTGFSPGGTNRLTSCTFHDRDRDRRYDARSEPVFADRAKDVVVDFGGRWIYGVVLTGVAEGEQVCSRTRQGFAPSDGSAATTSTTELTCYPVVFTPPGG